MNAVIRLFKDTFASWSEHQAPRMGAALSYYTAFSLAPLVVLLVGIVGLVLKRETVREELVQQFAGVMGQQGGETIRMILEHSAAQNGGVLATIIGFVTLLLGASGVFAELQVSLNQIWEAPKRKRSWTWLVKDRLLSFGMVFVFGFLILVSLALSAGIAAVGKFGANWAPILAPVWELANSMVSFLVITLLFAVLFRFLPEVRIAWRDVWAGAAMTGLLFVLGKFLLGIYIGHSAFASAYGAAGSLIVVLLWVFYSAQILFFGAEFTRAYACRHGSHCAGPKRTSGECLTGGAAGDPIR